jgi:hypothetical protein
MGESSNLTIAAFRFVPANSAAGPVSGASQELVKGRLVHLYDCSLARACFCSSLRAQRLRGEQSHGCEADCDRRQGDG